MIGLVDGNNFYVSCERIFDLTLENKPVAILSNNDGCVISRSYEFKALNIPMGAPYFKLRDHKNIIMRSSNYELYGDISRRLIATLHEFTPDVEQYSIDEAFIHINLPLGGDYSELGKQIRQTVLQWVGIPCGIGFAQSKTLAKIANHIAKKESSGVFVMPDDKQSVLDELHVSEVWGVGKRLAPQLETLGIRTAWQLAIADEVFLKKRFNVTLAKTARELRGESIIEHDDPEVLSQSISCSRSFGKPVINFSELTEAVAHYIARATVKLRKEKQRAAGINVYFQYFPEYKPYKLDGGITSTTIAFETPTSSTSKIISAVTPKLQGIFIKGRRYKKAGVIFFGLESQKNHSVDLFADNQNDEKTDRLSEAVDIINLKFGKGTVFNLAEGIKKPWAMKREMLSPNYTTNWQQLPKVK